MRVERPADRKEVRSAAGKSVRCQRLKSHALPFLVCRRFRRLACGVVAACLHRLTLRNALASSSYAFAAAPTTATPRLRRHKRNAVNNEVAITT